MTRSSDRLPRIAPELQRLIEAERRRAPPSREDLQRVYSRVSATLAGPSGGGGEPGASADADGAAEPAGAATATGNALASIGKVAGGLLLGAIVAAVAYHAGVVGGRPPLSASARLEEPTLSADHAAASPPARGEAAALAEAREGRGQPAVVPTLRQGRRRELPAGSGRHTGERDRRSSPRANVKVAAERVPLPPAPVAVEDQLAAERLLLDHARGALSRGKSDDGMKVLAEHIRRYPHGHLVEERDALLVLTLARAGRQKEAREAAVRFARRYPNSIMLPVLRETINNLRSLKR